MNCYKVRHHLSAYLDGELLGYEHRQIHQHLRQCTACNEEYEGLLQMKRLLSGLRMREPKPNLAASILHKVSEEKQVSNPFALGRAWITTQGKLLSYPQLIGVGVGLSLLALFLSARPLSSTTSEALRGQLLSFEPANALHDEPAPSARELTDGLIREKAIEPVNYSPDQWTRLPDPFWQRHFPDPRLSESRSSMPIWNEAR